MASTAQYVGAATWWNAGYTGKGIDVAVIDSGVSPVAGLDAPGTVLYGPDFSLESQAPNLTDLDTYGHGTFMAGLIAGHDATLSAPYANAPASAYRGIAPDARIVSLKVATADGGADVSQVIAAIDWVVQHAHDPGLNIRVISLSYGTNSTQSYGIDPLAYAVEQAWKHGIVVVASAGNTGYQRGNGAPGLADPGYDPYVIAVGASNSNGTPSISDDAVAAVLGELLGLRRVQEPRLRRAGRSPPGPASAELVRRREPSRGPPRRTVLPRQRHLARRPPSPRAPSRSCCRSTRRCRRTSSSASSRRTHRSWRASTRRRRAPARSDSARWLNATPQWSYTGQRFTNATGTGSLERSRGQDHLTRNGVVLTGERDIFGKPVDTSALAAAEAAGSSWSGGNWNGSSWSGSSWSGSSWSGSSWSGSSWSGSSWSGSSWSGSSWSGAQLVGQLVVGQQLVRQLVVRLVVGLGLLGLSR